MNLVHQQTGEPTIKPIEISDSTFEQEVLRNKHLTIVDFWAPWCGPCRLIAPLLEQIALQYDGQVKVTKLNVDENLVIPGKLGIRGIPTLLFVENGTIVDKLVGAVPKNQLEVRVNRLLSI